VSLRAGLVSRCKELSAGQRIARSSSLVRHLREWVDSAAARAVGLYAARSFEIDPGALRSWADGRGIRVFFPKVSRARRRMDFVLVEPPEKLVSGCFSIFEPVGDGPRLAEGDRPAVVLVPGIAFDRWGRRVGSGLGYYDRALQALGQGITLVGVGYSFQIMNFLPEDPWDVRMDLLATDEGIIDCLGPATGDVDVPPSRPVCGK